MAIPFAGNFDRVKFDKIFSPGAQGFYGAPKDEYEEIDKQYPNQPPPDFSKLSGTDLLLAKYMNPDSKSLILQARLGDIAARRASELARQNIDYATAKQRAYESERDKERFKYGMLARIPEVIGEAFAAPGKYALLGSQMGTQSLANVLNTPSASFQSVSPQYQKYLS